MLTIFKCSVILLPYGCTLSETTGYVDHQRSLMVRMSYMLWAWRQRRREVPLAAKNFHICHIAAILAVLSTQLPMALSLTTERKAWTL